jgi:hypothetical protein
MAVEQLCLPGLEPMFNQYSPSKIKVLKKCPLQFYLKYVSKYEPQIKPDHDVTNRDTGTLLHSVLEFAVKGISVDKAVMLTRAKHEFTDEFWNDNVSPHLPNVGTFLSKLDKFKTFHRIDKVSTELKMGVTKDWKATHFFDSAVFYRGIIDLLLISKSTAKAIILDHKSGGSGQWGIKMHKPQLDVYKPFILASHSEVEEVAAGIHFVKEGSVVLEKSFSPKDLIIKSIIPTIEHDAYMAERDVRETGFFKHYRGPHCIYCDFDADCKAKKLVTIEKESGKVLTNEE